jgi:hypothetical protein
VDGSAFCHLRASLKHLSQDKTPASLTDRQPIRRCSCSDAGLYSHTPLLSLLVSLLQVLRSAMCVCRAVSQQAPSRLRAMSAPAVLSRTSTASRSVCLARRGPTKMPAPLPSAKCAQPGHSTQRRAQCQHRPASKCIALPAIAGTNMRLVRSLHALHQMQECPGMVSAYCKQGNM